VGYSCSFILLFLFFSCKPEPVDPPWIYVESLPDFSRIEDIQERKKEFFNFLTPLIHQQNKRIEKERSKSILLFGQLKKDSVTTQDSTWLYNKAMDLKVKNFNMNNIESQMSLLMKMDLIPVALALAQAANESSWGTSRFAKDANNIFGQWCFTPGCGLVPRKRTEGASHEIRIFKTINASIKSYMRNINRNTAYKTLRTLRYQMKINNEPISSLTLATGLEKYSIRRKAYVKDIQTIIRVNNLESD
jgi:Bax protein